MPAIFLSIIFIFLSPCYAWAQPLAAYRVIHSSPEDVVTALTLPNKQQTSGATRLGQYFHIKNKTIKENETTLEIIPKVAMFERQIQAIKISLKKKSKDKNTFHFDSHFEIMADKFFNAKMQISPYQSGSIVFLEVQDTNIPSSAMNTFYYVVKKMGFISDSREVAIQKDLAEK